MTTDPISEKDFASRLNLSRTTLRELRGELLTEKEDWLAEEKDGRIMLLPSGVAKIEARLQREATGDDSALDNAVTSEPPPPEVLTFYAAKRVPNPHIILATEDPARKKKPVMIRVKNNATYKLGKPIYAIAGTYQVYQAVRAPRGATGRPK